MLQVGPPPCYTQTYVLSLTSEDADTCLHTVVVPSAEAVRDGCHGDSTDSCCRANPAFPGLDASVVAVGRYHGTGQLLDGGDVDIIDFDSLCLPADASPLPPRR